MNKQEQIEEMANIPHKCIKSSCEDCIKNDRKCTDYKQAEALYNAGYRVVPDGATVLLVGKYNQALDKKTIEYFIKHNEQIRKETAREILQKVINICRKEEDFQDGTVNTQLEPLYFGIMNGCVFVRGEVKELAKQYGVEVEE